MKGYVARKGDRWYAVIYEGLDPVTGKERRSWHPAGTSRKDAERLAASLATDLNGRNDAGRPLTFGVYLTTRWLPGKKVELAHSTWDGYRRKIELHVLPAIGTVPWDAAADTATSVDPKPSSKRENGQQLADSRTEKARPQNANGRRR